MAQEHKKISRLSSAVAALACAILVTGPAALAGPDEDERAAIETLQAFHLLGWGAGFAALPIIALPGGTLEFQTNLSLKYLPAYLEAPQDIVRRPSPGSNCSYHFNYEPYMELQRSNYLDAIQLWNSPFDIALGASKPDWGELGEPRVIDHYHTNTNISVRLKDRVLGTDPAVGDLSDTTVIVSTGVNLFTWRADTMVTPLLDYVPWYVISYAAKDRGKQIAATAKNAKTKRAALKGIKLLADAAGSVGVSLNASNLGIDSEKVRNVYTEVKQRFVVLDVRPPEIHTDPATQTGFSPADPYIVRAVDPGGSYFDSFVDDLMANFTATDDCAFGDDVRIEPVLTPQTPGIEAPGNFFVTDDVREVIIRARDKGPVERPCEPGEEDDYAPRSPCYDKTGKTNTTELSVWVKVEDKEPPLLIPPNNKVVEATPEMEAQGYAVRATDETPADDPASVELGNAAVFDLGDRYPVVEDDGTAQFPVNSRTTVDWWATDLAGNRTENYPQVITIKAAGTNTAPFADANSAETRVSEPVAITLTGFDADPAIDGKTDPLNFRISRAPSNGFLLAPPNPYFIEDYRRTWQEEGLPCDQQRTGAISNPEQISVTDDGLTFVLAYPADCRSGKQITIYDADGEFVDSTWADERVNSFEVRSGVPNAFDVPFGVPANAREPGVYFMVESQFEHSAIGHQPIEADGTVADDFGGRNNWGFGNSPIKVKQKRLVTVDSRGYAWTLGNGFDVYQLAGGGELIQVTPRNEPNNGVGLAVLNGKPASHLTTDTDDYLYVSQPNRGRIYKFEPADVTIGSKQLVGWMGRCNGGEDCDVENRRSYGFSCTDQTCDVESFYPGYDEDRAAELEACGLPVTNSAEGLQPGEGCQPGQFNFPTKIALDANNNLYVADYYNRRVQRFTASGEFTGEAKSKCDGSCFVLGDFGRPFKMSVNSFGFYVLDEKKELLHVFEASPFKEVTADSAVVEYQSSFDILGVDDVTAADSFEFTVNDGLAESAPATVGVTVTRNYRAPIAQSTVVVEGEALPVLPVIEDVPQRFVLQGRDPDLQDEASLTYRVTTPPAHGSVMAVGDEWEYVPDPEFSGTDQFAFVVSDEATSMPAFDSEPATVAVEVAAVPDPVTVDMPDPAEAGTGFPVQLMVDVADPDTDAGDIEAYVDWGDGCVDWLRDGESTIVCSTANPDGDTDPGGRLSLSLAAGNPGILIAEHIYRTAGTRSVRVCLGDAEVGPVIPVADDDVCTLETIDALGTVDVAVSRKADAIAIFDDDLERDEDGRVIERREAGVPVDVTLTLRNRQPSADSTDSETPLSPGVATVELEERLYFVSLPPFCTQTASIPPMRMTCPVPPLPTGQEIEVNFAVAAEETLLEDIDQAVRLTIDAPEPDVDGGYFWANTLPFEMNPDLDADGDGVPNGEDAFPGDPTESEDTDGDGIGNNADRDDDNDSIPDYWETRHGLDSLDASDGGADLDGDGLTNVQEYRAGTRPDVADSDRDGSEDATDNCPLSYNRQQHDANGDFLGDTCDPRSFAAAAAVGDADGDGTTDVALMRTDDGGSVIYVKSGASDIDIAVYELLTADEQPEDLLALADAGDGRGPLLAVVYRERGGIGYVRTVRAWSGEAVADFEVFDDDRRLAGAAVHADGDTLLVLAENGDRTLELQHRDPRDGSRLADHPAIMRNVDGLAIVAMDVATAGIVAVENSGVLFSEARNLQTGDQEGEWIPADGNWLAAEFLGTGDGLVVLVTDTAGTSEIRRFATSSERAIASFAVFDDAWTPLAMLWTADDGSAVAVSASDGDGNVEVRVYDLADGTERSRTAYLAPDLAPRAALLTDASDPAVAVLASDESGALLAEQRSTTTGQPGATLTAASVQPPAPPAPPPVSPPPAPPGNGGNSGGGGGGGHVDLLLLGTLLAMIAGRRRRDATLR